LKTLFTAFALLFSACIIYSQTEERQSIAIQPPFLNISPNGTQSSVVITNGYDNIFLGTDFGEPYIATNPRDPLNSICSFYTNGVYYTLDGYNWVRNSPIFAGYSVLGDPVMTYDSIGNCIYAQLYQNGSTYGIAVMKTTNKGVNWVGPYNVWNTTVGLADKEWICADQTGGPYSNNVYVVWRQFGAAGMRFTRSTDGGVTWSAPHTYSGGQGAFVTVGPNGNTQGGSVYTASTSGGSIVVNRSTDGGITFSTQVIAAIVNQPGVPCAGRRTVKDCIRMNDFPHMAADNGYTSTRGNVYLVYCGNPSGPDNCDIYLTRSTDYGQTWSPDLRVNDDNTTTDQWMPTVSVDKNSGRVYVTWYDSRVDPANNLMTRIYSAVSTNGGVSFEPNQNVSDISFNPNSMAVGQPGGEKYIGDYMGNSAIRNTAYHVWMDGRNNNLGSYVGYYPDYAMNVNPSLRNLVNGDSTTFSVSVPSIKGPFPERVRFSATFDTLPQSGTLQVSFLNGRDSTVTAPDSVTLKIRAIGNVTPRLYKVRIKGVGSLSGTPVHIRTVDLLVNTSMLTIGTNRNTICDFKVNGIQYNTTQQLVFPNASVVTVQAISPKTVGFNRYVYVNWSDNGDTTHTVTMNSNLTLTANYKAQYRLVINSSIGNTFGDNYYDSNTTAQFRVNSRIFIFNGTSYTFRGWLGNGQGSYTSPDSTGNDSAVSVVMANPIVETARWTAPIGINALGTEIPKEYKLYQNFPNPFNPQTNINFDITKAGNVKIIIYDLLGRDVETLVNMELNPGRYNVDFDGSAFASGLYFYRITAGEFVDIKKMLIVK
jgi:hypothetical protein